MKKLSQALSVLIALGAFQATSAPSLWKNLHLPADRAGRDQRKANRPQGMSNRSLPLADQYRLVEEADERRSRRNQRRLIEAHKSNAHNYWSAYRLEVLA